MYNTSKTSEQELREIFFHYSVDQKIIPLSQLIQICSDYSFPVSSVQIYQFFKENMITTDSSIDFVEFAQFVRHQESTIKRIFNNLPYRDEDMVSTDQLRQHILHYKKQDTRFHYFWDIDVNWVDHVFNKVKTQTETPKGNNGNKKIVEIDPKKIHFGEFRKHALLHSTPCLKRLYYTQESYRKNEQKSQNLSSSSSSSSSLPNSATSGTDLNTGSTLTTSSNNVIENQGDFKKEHESSNNNEDIRLGLMPLTDEELHDMFKEWSGNQEYIDMKTLFEVVRQAKVPVSEHQLLEFFYRCDINEDGMIDFVEFEHFIREEEGAIRRIFEELDIDKAGTVSAGMLKKVMHANASRFRVDEQTLDAWVDAVISNIAGDKKNRRKPHYNEASDISYDEFRRYAILSNARNLKNMIGPFRPQNRFTFVGHVYIPLEAGEVKELQDENLLRIIIFMSGLTAGVVSRTVTAPLDRLKIHMQATSRGTITEHLRDMIEEGGYRSLWRANLTNCVKMGPELAVKFTTHDYFKQFFEERYHTNLFTTNSLAGALAGITSQTIIYPLEIAKTRMALGMTGQHRNFIHCLRELVRHEGVTALYRGWNVSVAGIIPYASVEMGVFFSLKEEWKNVYGDQPLTFSSLIAFSLTSGVAGSMVSYPFQLIRTKLQAQGMPGRTKTKNYYTFSGPIDCLKKTVQHTGYSGLYAGLLPNLLKALPATVLSYVVVERTKGFLRHMYNV